MITSISKLFQHKKLTKRLLSGAVATTLIFATLLSDVNIAYAQTGNGDLSNIIAEKSVATEETEASVDEEKNDNKQDEAKDEAAETEAPENEDVAKEEETAPEEEASEDVAKEGEVSPEEEASDETPKDETSEGEVSPEEETSDEKTEDEISTGEVPADDSENTENTENTEDVTTDVEEGDLETEKVGDVDETEEKNKAEEKKSEEEPKEMPAISIEKTVEDYKISLECKEGTFAEGTTVEIRLLEDKDKEEVDKLVEEAITEDVDIVKTVSFDITFHDKDGSVVEPADKNSVSVKVVPSKQDKEELENIDIQDDTELLCSVFHVEDDKNVEEIECKTEDPVEEIIFEAESFSIYNIVWYKADGGEDPERKGPQEIGDFIKSRHTFINFDLPLSFTNEGSPADSSLRPEKLEFEVYGKDTTAFSPEDVLICKVTVPIQNYNETVKLKESGKSQTEIPVYVRKGTQALEDKGNGKHEITGFEYTVKFTGTGEGSVYTIQQGSTGINITSIINHAEWSGKGTDTLIAERQALASKKFYVSWVDNRNIAGKRPYSTNDDFTDEAAKTAFKNSIKLYRQVGDGIVQHVTDEMVPTATLADAGPIVGRKGLSISDWEISYNNLPTVTSDGTAIKYYITVDDPTGSYALEPSFSAWYSPEDFADINVDGVTKKAILEGNTAKYIYSEYFTATVQWYDKGNEASARLTKETLSEEFIITDELGNIIVNAEKGLSNIVWTKTDGDEWTFKVGPLPMYNEEGGEKSYKLVLKDSVITAKDAVHEYSVDYSNGTKTTSHEYCLSDGKIVLVIDRAIDSFKIEKTWADGENQDSRKEAIESGVRFLLWRYPETKQDGSVGTPADKAAVFNPETHTQYSYTLKMDDSNVVELATEKVKDSIDITLAEFGVTTAHPVDMYDQYGHKYIYFATEVIAKSGYKSVYSNVDPFDDEKYSKYGVMNGGTMKNVRQEQMKMQGIVKWNTPAVNDYTKTTVTIELQKYEDGNWVTVKGDDDNDLTKELSGFTVTNPKKSYIFPSVERFDENGEKIEYRVVQTKVNYSGVDISINNYSPKVNPNEFTSEVFGMNTKDYQADVAPTPDTADSYTIENRLAGDMELALTKIWADDGDNGFGKDGCTTYQNITINVYQHGVSTDYSKPYMTITTNGSTGDDAKGTYFKKYGIEASVESEIVTEKDIPFTITYREGLGKESESGVIRVAAVDKYETDGRAKRWEFKKISGETLSNIFVPAFNENGNAYSYTIEERPVAGAYTTYSYERNGNELDANVTNKYAIGGSNVRTVIFQKEWIDGTDIPQEKPLRFAVVRINKNGEFYYTGSGEIDLSDNFGDKHIVTLTDNNNWYNQLSFDLGKTKIIDGVEKNCFDSIESEGGSKRYLYTAIELDMAQGGTTDFSREVNYNKSSTAAGLKEDIDNTSTCSEFRGSIDAYLDESYEENHLPGYDVTVKSANDTTSVIDATKYVAINKRKGVVNVTFKKNWHDGSNSEGTRDGEYRVYVYQNGKKVVKTDITGDSEVKIDSLKVTIDGVVKADGLAEIAYPVADKDNPVITFEGLPQYDNDGNMYQYTVKEFLVKDGIELEIAITDTKDSSKTGYEVSEHFEETHFKVNDIDKTILERNSTYEYTNTITGEKLGGANFYVLWHDQTIYDKGKRPDVNCILYYRVKGSDQTPQVYKGEYKLEWHPMPDTGTAKDPSDASRYYQYANFTKIPLANDEGEPYEYFAVPSLSNAGEHYDEFFYKSNDVIEAAGILTSAGKHHYDMAPGAEKLPDGTKMLPEDGLVEYIIDEIVHIEGVKIWKLGDSGEFDKSKLPDAKIFLWRENEHNKQYSENLTDNPEGRYCGETTLNDDKTGYAFKKDDGTYIEFPKYDDYGLIYDYSVSEEMFITSSNESQKYKYSIPNYVMEYQRVTNGITNVYNPVSETGKHNLRKITVTKKWEGSIDKNPIAEFGLYRVEIPLTGEYYTASGSDNILSPNPTKDAYRYAIEELNKFKANPETSRVEELGVKSIKYIDGATEQSVVWDDMPIFAPSGLVYLYFAEELSKHGIESFKYGVMTEAAGSRPAVNVIDAVDTSADRTNVLINYNSDDSAEIVRAGAVLFSNYGLAPSETKDYVNGSSVHANWQEAGYKNEFNDEVFGKIVGYKEWNDGIFADNVRPRIDDEDKGISLKLYRSAATQTGHGNQVNSVEIPSDNYDVIWEATAEPNKWKFEITPKEGITDEFKLYSTNGRPYTYSVTESISGTTLANYKIANKTITGSVAQVKKINETDSEMTLKSSLKNELKGQIRVYKKWDDALDEHRLRTDKVKVLLQYRMVQETPVPYVAGTYNEADPPEISKWKEFGTYTLSYGNHWSQTVEKLPIKSEVIDGINYRYEYRLLETEFVDMGTTLYPVDADGSGASQAGSVPISKVPNGGFCTDATPEADRKTLYGNSTSSEYKNKYYEIEIGNYHVNNSEIAALQVSDSSISSKDLLVDNRLSKKTILKIEKKWEGVNAGEAEVKILDSYGVLPDSLTFKIEYKEQDGEWKPLYKDGTIEPVLVVVKKYVEEDAGDDYAGYASYVHTVENLPVERDGKALVYRAIELTPDLTKKDNLGRFEFSDDTDGYPKHIHVPAYTTVINKLEYRDITIRKRWNAADELRNPVTVELWSDNFTASSDAFSLVKNTTKTLTAANGWEVTYNNLPKYNTKHDLIHYYVKESKVGTADFNTNNYAIHFFEQTGESDYYEVTDRYGTNVNIAPVHKDAYEMYIVNTPKTFLRVAKNWEDEENRQGSRANVNVTLSDDNGMTPDTKQLKTTQGSVVTWNYLPIYKKPDVDFVKGSAEHADKVNYTIKEADTLKTSKGYKTPEYSFGGNSAVSDSGYVVNLNNADNNATIINTYNPPKIKFTATKKWDDEENRHYSRPLQKGIYVTLYYSTDNQNWKKVDEKLSAEYEEKNYPTGSKVYTLSNITQHITDNGGNTWGEAVWEGLPTKVSNKLIYYKAFETDENGAIKVTPGYSATYSPASIKASDGEASGTVSQEITNTLLRTSMLVNKEWGNTYDLKDRPDAVSLVLEYKCGNAPWEVYKNTDGTVLIVTLTGTGHTSSSAHVWEKKVDNLPSINSEGIKYEYRVKEVSVTYDGNEVYADGVSAETVSSAIFTRDGASWKSENTVGAFKDLVVTSPSESSEYSYKVTAVNTPIIGQLTVVKKWDDEGNRDNIRPNQIKLQLYRRQNEEAPVKYGEPVVMGPEKAGTTVSADENEWTYTFDKLPVYNNDASEHTEENKSIYYVKEVDPKHEYEVTYIPKMGTSTTEFDSAHNILLQSSSGDTYSTSETITNKHTPVRIKIAAKKEWLEGAQKFRPESVKVKLQYCIDGEEEWNDVSVVASQSALDITGTKVETTSTLDRILKGTSEADVWEKDETGNSVIWENLPAYVNNGKKVKYRLYEYDDTPDNQKISDHYIVIYNHCEYDTEYGAEYVLKAQNIIKDMGGILTVDKKWQQDNKDDIALNDKIISEIQCHIEYKSILSIIGNWEKPDWGKFVLSHDDNWQHTIVHELSTMAVYRVVEDAIVYKDRETGEKVTVEANGNRVGSFEWSTIPEVIKADDQNALMQATITNAVPDNSVTVSKIWQDENNRDGMRTHSIKVRLLRDGQPVGEDVILFPKDENVDGPWDEYTWHNLPIYKNGVLEDGNLVKSEYTVEEIVDSEFSEAYTISYKVDNGEDKDLCDNITFDQGLPKDVKVAITNLHETHKKTIVAGKIWKDENDKYSTRPKKLFSNEYHTYLMLLYKLNDVETAKWAPVKHYSNYDDFEKRGYQYPDHHIYTTSPVIQEISGNNEESWENAATWENVSTRGVDDTPTTPGPDLTDEPDRNVSFMIIEVPGLDYDFINDSNNSKDAPKSIAPAGYRVETEPEILNPEEEKVIVEFAKLTNILITTSLNVEKTWEDQEDKYNTRPEKIRVKLERRLKDSEDDWKSVKQNDDDIELELSVSDNWKGSFNNLPLYDKEKNEFEYRAIETALIYAGNEIALSTPTKKDGKLEASGGNYISIMENVLDDGNSEADTPKFKLLLTNKLKDEGTTFLTVNKTWIDENNRDRLRPSSISVNLIRDGVKVDTATIYGTSWTEHTWQNLPLYQRGSDSTKSVYTVEEEPVADYESLVAKSSDDEHVVITNTHIPKKAVITADKIWEDAENTYSTRPKEIYLRLLYKYEGDGDSEYRIVPEYPKDTFDKDGMYTSENAEGVFTTSQATQKCTGKDNENWTNVARWENLPIKASPDGSEYEPKTVIYKVIEVKALDTDNSVNTSEAVAGYEVTDAAIEGNKLNTEADNSVNITNALVTTELNVTKVFEDEYNKYNTRPDSIEVQVLRRVKNSTGDGEWKPVKVKGDKFENDLIVTLTKDEAFSKKLEGLPKYDKDEHEYEYSCLEKNLIFGDRKIPVEESNVSASYNVSGSDAKIKNTLITTSLTVAKIWDDNFNAKGTRPEKLVFSVEQKETKGIVSSLIGNITELFTGKDGYSELKLLEGDKEVPVEIVIEGPEFNEYTLEGLPAYSKDGNLYSYRAVETKLVYEDREILVEKDTSLYEKPVYELEVIESGEDSKGNKAYKYSETVLNKIIPKKKPKKKKKDKPKDEETEPTPVNPGPVIPAPVPPTPVPPIPKYEIIDDTDPEVLPEEVTDTIYEIIDLPDDEERQEKVVKLYIDLVKITQEDPTFIDKLDEETADIVKRFLATGVLGRRRTRLPKTGGVVGSAMALLFAVMLIGIGVAIRPADESDKKEKAQK